jgi:hypothetical protein
MSPFMEMEECVRSSLWSPHPSNAREGARREKKSTSSATAKAEKERERERERERRGR